MKKRLVFALIIVFFLGVMIQGVFAQSISMYQAIPHFEEYYAPYDSIYGYGFTQKSYGNVYFSTEVSLQPQHGSPSSSVGISTNAPRSFAQGTPQPDPPNYPYWSSQFFYSPYLLSGICPQSEPPSSPVGISTRLKATSSLAWISPIPEPPQYPYWLNIFALGPQPEPLDISLRSSKDSKSVENVASEKEYDNEAENEECNSWARGIAQDMLDDMSQDPLLGWDESSHIAGCYPIYLPGLDAPSYFEFKVKNAEKDAGYILVNVDESDILVPEVSTEGLTLTEMYEKETWEMDLKVVRYNCVRSTAKLQEDEKNAPAIIASIGFSQYGGISLHDSQYSANGIKLRNRGDDPLLEEIESYDQQYQEKVSEKNCVPWETREGLDEYYESVHSLEEETATEEESAVERMYTPRKRVGTRRRRFLRRRFLNDWHLPQWYQPRNSAGYPVGCGNVAWAMVYAYWKQFKGKSALFDGTDLLYLYEPGSCNSGIVNDVMWEIFDLTETSHGENSGGKYGLTRPSRMAQGIEYAKRKGYNEAYVTRWRGSQSNKFRAIEEEIENDRPVILLIHDEGFGFPRHYVAVEGTYYYKEGLKKSLGYYANFGWGTRDENAGLRKWIFDRGKGVNYSIYDAFLVHMEDEDAPTGLRVRFDDVYGQTYPLRNEFTYCGTDSEDVLPFRVDGFFDNCSRARVEVVRGSIVRQVLYVSEDEQNFIELGGMNNRIELRTYCGTENVTRQVYRDIYPPTFRGISVLSRISNSGPVIQTRNPVRLDVYGLYDDGYWLNNDYTIEAVIDGHTRRNGSGGTTINLGNLSLERHTVDVKIQDGCGCWSEEQSLTFDVVSTSLEVSFVRPNEGASVNPGSNLVIEVDVRATGSAIESVVLSLDHEIDEFGYNHLYDFPGPWALGSNNRKCCTIRANWSRGDHKLIIVAYNRAGQRTKIERNINVYNPYVYNPYLPFVGTLPHY